MAGMLLTFAQRWQASAEACLLVPFRDVFTGRVPHTEGYPFPYMSILPASGRLHARSDRAEFLRRTLTVHVWVDPAKLEEGETIQEMVRRIWANQAWSYDYGRVIDVLDGGLNAHELNEPTFQAWELVRLLTLCYEHPRVDNPECAPRSSSSTHRSGSSFRRSGSSFSLAASNR